MAKDKKETSNELPKTETPKEVKEVKPEKVDWKVRAEELEEENATLKEKPLTCPHCQRSDCCGVK